MGGPFLFIFSGLPATGKSTLARLLAEEYGSAYLRIDSIEVPLAEAYGAVDGNGYGVACRVAADNLALGNSVVADSCNPIATTRLAWEGVAKAADCGYANIEVVCSDTAEHRRRVETRPCEVPGLRLPTWEEVESREYRPWHAPHITVDTAGRTIGECFQELLSLLQGPVPGVGCL